MAKNTVDIKTLAFIPKLEKGATWEEAWGYIIEKYGLSAGLYDRYVKDEGKSHHYELELSIYKSDTEESLLSEKKYTGDIRDKMMPGGVDFDMNVICRIIIETLIEIKFLKKSRSSKKIQVNADNELEELKKQRHRLTMKMSAWKKVGKDVAPLIQEKNDIIKRIKKLS